MAIRFTDTEIWNEDWFIELGIEYQHLWNYIKDNCNHAGIWKPNKSGFEMRAKTKVNLDSFFKQVNGDKERILGLRDRNWFLTGFIKFQWFNKKEGFDLVLTNRLHLSIFNELKKGSVPLEKVRGLQEVLETSRVKDTVFVKQETLAINQSLLGDKADFLTNQRWKEEFCIAKRIELYELEQLQEEWLADVDLKEEYVDNYKRYFINWYNKNLPKAKQKPKRRDTSRDKW